MPRTFPALLVRWPQRPSDDHLDRLQAEIDDDRPSAIEDRDGGVDIFFTSAADRDRALEHVAAFDPSAALTTDAVDDESWAERSQASVGAIDVGRITVAPPWVADTSDGTRIRIVIEPSMGFGTGHHPSTRLCLDLLQRQDLAGGFVVDIGTGSGVLAIAAWRLGAREVLALDYDADALLSAQENVDRNGAGAFVRLQQADILREGVTVSGSPRVVLANITGAMLRRIAPILTTLAGPDTRVIVSGFQTDEEHEVVEAFSPAMRCAARAEEATWVSVLLQSAR
jgi:ribosomal protein L11 methyltransferase